MHPDLSFIKEKFGKESSVQALVEYGKQYALYLYGQKKNSIRLELPAGTYRIEWTNPLTGAKTLLRKLKHAGGVINLATPKYNADIALAITHIN